MIVFVFVFVVDPALLGLCFVGVFFVHGDGVVPELMLLRPPRRPRPVRRLPLVRIGEYEWGFGVFGFGRVTGPKGKGNEKWVIWNDEMVRGG